MAKAYARTVHLVRVTTDDREQQIWAAAASREDAVDRVLDAVPEGWSAVLLDARPTAREITWLNLSAGEVRRLRGGS
jgi:hypothetical protein